MVAPDARAGETRSRVRPAVEGETLTGIAVSPGIAIAEITTVVTEDYQVPEREIGEADVEAEVARFRGAVADVIEEIAAIRDGMGEELGSEGTAIFDAQLMILRDPLAIETTERDIRAQRRNAEFLFRQNVLRALESFDAMGGGLFKERAADIRDVKRRVIRRLLGIESAGAKPKLAGACIVAAHEMTPSDTVTLAQQAAVGFVTETGGRTSHAAIMARARQIPAVMGVPALMERVGTGTRAVLDGSRGKLILNPSRAEERRYERLREHYRELHHRLELLRELSPVTKDGREIHLHANIELPLEVEMVKRNGANGVGLFRTEFFFMQRSRLPTEEEQFEAYRSVVGQMSPQPVVIRTMDLGGDKFTSYIGADREKNPFLGLRGIRFLLGHEDVFRAQLRAILRASAYGPVRIMLPMVATLEELRQARRLLEQGMEALRGAGLRFDRHVPLGVMIETPAAVFISDLLARECDFFSIGSNDLTQYSLAIDRTNAKLGYLFNSFHPSVLRAIQTTVDAAHREGCWVSLCGEMAGDPLATVLLVGLGLDDLSMSPAVIPEIKQLVRSITYDEALGTATRAIRLSTAAEVEELVREFMCERFPDLVDVHGW